MKITFNGNCVEARDGISVYDAAAEAGVIDRSVIAADVSVTSRLRRTAFSVLSLCDMYCVSWAFLLNFPSPMGEVENFGEFTSHKIFG